MSVAEDLAGGGGGIEDEEEEVELLKKQNLATLRVEDLTVLTPEVISRQATINIGTIGHVAHGKSTLVKAISTVKTVRFKNELVRNITIKLGYANAKIYRSVEGPPFSYESQGSAAADEYENTEGRNMRLVRHVSFVDCPGHDILMATMLNGAAVMDAAILLISANEVCPMPQTSEHLAAVELMQMKNIIVCQNKVDLVKEEAAKLHFDSIQAFVDGTIAGSAPVIPISAQLKYNIDKVCKAIVKKVPIPTRNFTAPPRMIIIRSFDVNHPGEEVGTLKGGVAGGSILQGVLRVGDEVEIRPGHSRKADDGSFRCNPIFSRITTLKAESNELQFAVPGGLIGVGLLVDPTLTRADRLVGQVLGTKGSLPDIFVEIEVRFYLLKKLLGVKTADGEKAAKVSKLVKGEMLMANIGSTSVGARVMACALAEESKEGVVQKKSSEGVVTLSLTQPVCTLAMEKVALSRRIEGHWRLIGWGVIQKGLQMVEGANGVFAAAAVKTASDTAAAAKK